MKTLFSISLCALLLSACASAPAPRTASGDGTSVEHAIAIDAQNEEDGVTAEYAWIDAHFPGYRRERQSLIDHGARMYDAIDITTATGEAKTLYFDITGFFGKL